MMLGVGFVEEELESCPNKGEEERRWSWWWCWFAVVVVGTYLESKSSESREMLD